MTPSKAPELSQDPLAPEDPYLWLEDVTGDKALDWVRAANAQTAKELEGGEAYASMENDILEILDSKSKIPYIGKRGAHFYNFWRDAEHPRGIWRRTTLEEYRKPEPHWELVLDIDALDEIEKQGWVFHGAQFLKPGFQRCLLSLSPGGSDAVVIREFDTEAKAFVPDGFEVPLAKTDVSWIDLDTIFVGTDFGLGSMTTSGYPRIAKIWRRGTPLAEATVVFEGKDTDMVVGAYHDSTPGFERDFLFRRPSFFTGEAFLLPKDRSHHKIDVPDDSEPEVHLGWTTIRLRPHLDGRPSSRTSPQARSIATTKGATSGSRHCLQVPRIAALLAVEVELVAQTRDAKVNPKVSVGFSNHMVSCCVLAPRRE